jgi:hypothetical protein
MASLTAKNIKDLNRMNTAAKNAALGDKLNVLTSASATQGALISVSGSKAVVAEDVTNSRVVVTPGTVSGFMFQMLRSGSVITHQMKAVSGSVAGTKIITSGSGYANIAAGDVVTYIAFP